MSGPGRVGARATLVQIVADARELAETAARAALADLEAAIDAHDTCTWVLTGGTTPVEAYRLLAGHDLRSAVEWGRVRIAMGDERCVPLDDPESNWGQAAAALLDHVPIAREQRLPVHVELGAEAAAADYEAVLRRLPPARPAGRREAGATAPAAPRLEVMWLGVGPDGHCLSLFPGRPELEVPQRLVVPVHGAPKPPPERVSLTLAALTGVERLVVLASGDSKAEAVARAREGDQRLPITRAIATVEGAGGMVRWLLDRAAAGG
jgi:6-phosphogluconolactonase